MPERERLLVRLPRPLLTGDALEQAAGGGQLHLELGEERLGDVPGRGHRRGIRCAHEGLSAGSLREIASAAENRGGIIAPDATSDRPGAFCGAEAAWPTSCRDAPAVFGYLLVSTAPSREGPCSTPPPRPPSPPASPIRSRCWSASSATASSAPASVR